MGMARYMSDIRFPKRPPSKIPPPAPPSRPRRRPPFLFLGAFLGAVLLAILFVQSGFWSNAKSVFGFSRLDDTRESSTGGAWDLVLKGFEKLTDMKDASLGALGLLGRSEEIMGELLKLSLAGKREELLLRVEDLRKEAAAVESALAGLGADAVLEGKIAEAITSLDASIAWLKAPEPRRVIVVFGNSSELRPGGGFMGSFADVELRHGAITALSVHDVNEIDRLLEANIIPPKPVQAIASRWRTADANWFFDFPSSAQKILEFVERSDYAGETKFDGVVMLSPRVVADILAVTGAITLPDGTTITKDNFIEEIQKSVQEGQAAGVLEPKDILADVAPVMRENLLGAPSGAIRSLAKQLPGWIAEKDLMIYAKDKGLAKSLRLLAADGSLYGLSDAFFGDYLAVVNANLGGGKTDIFMRQEAVLESRIAGSGTVANKVRVTRRHAGDAAGEWWYREPNWNYLRVFAPPGAAITGFSGGTIRTFGPRADFSKGYSIDPDIAGIERTLVQKPDFKGLDMFRESGRQVFASWVKTNPGETSAPEFAYSRPLPSAPKDGDRYTFLFESQAAADTTLAASFEAPEGFMWEENNERTYVYRSDNPPGRIEIHLTFKRQ